MSSLSFAAGSSLHRRALVQEGPRDNSQASWLTHWRSVDELHQITDAWNQVRVEKMWQRASPGVDATESPPGEAAGQVLTGQRTREALDDLAWTASLPDDSQVQVRAVEAMYSKRPGLGCVKLC